MRDYSAYALMSFNTQYDFVYESIKRAASAFLTSHGVTIDIKRADEYLETKRSKVQGIRDRIDEADFLIIDFSERSDNVMWEFGFSQCLNKHIIALDSSLAQSPFNVAETDKIRYTLSRAGLVDLEAKLQRAFVSAIDAHNADAAALLEDPDMKRLWVELEQCLRSIPSASLTHKLVSNELERITSRVTSIQRDRFELRNVKPPKEITDYYSDYISQLEGPDCSFSTVTCCDFWITISEGNRNAKYLMANKRALENGARIQRVFALSQERFSETNEQFGQLMYQVLKEHGNWVESFGTESIEAKVIVVENPREQSSYPNLGLLRKKDELLLFHPQYDQSGAMQKTVFYYSRTGGEKREIRTAMADFELARERSVHLRDFEAPWYQMA